MDDVTKYISDELRAALTTHGFHKVAAQVLQLPDVSERAIYERIGTKLAERRAEWSAICNGIKALQGFAK